MIPASSQASSELSTPSLIVVSSAFDGLSKPSRWRFLAKNSEIEMSRCLRPISAAVLFFRAAGAAGRRALARLAGFAFCRALFVRSAGRVKPLQPGSEVVDWLVVEVARESRVAGAKHVHHRRDDLAFVAGHIRDRLDEFEQGYVLGICRDRASCGSPHRCVPPTALRNGVPGLEL